MLLSISGAVPDPQDLTSLCLCPQDKELDLEINLGKTLKHTHQLSLHNAENNHPERRTKCCRYQEEERLLPFLGIRFDGWDSFWDGLGWKCTSPVKLFGGNILSKIQDDKRHKDEKHGNLLEELALVVT